MRDDDDRSACWAGADYVRASTHHRSYDDWFLAQHPPRPQDQVVDAGCGSGEFTARLAESVPNGSVIGVEPDPSMLEAARRHRAGNLEFRAGRVQDLDRVCEPASTDLVVSRAVFHWIPLEEYVVSYAAILRVLRPGGWLHAESGGAGNVEAVREVLDLAAAQLSLGPARVTFPHPGTVLELLESVGFDPAASVATTVAQRRTFDREQLLAFIRTQAAVAYGASSDPDLLDRFVGEASRHVEELRRHDGSYDQTFVRLHVRARRPA